jgi:GMP synthase (glutamine-hydrolysing)
MKPELLIVNTHTGENPQFIDLPRRFASDLGMSVEVLDGYGGVNPQDLQPKRVLLTGVPLEAEYSLSDIRTQKVVEGAFGWLRDARIPLMGVCYGLQILAHIFGGQVAPLPETVIAERYPLTLEPKIDAGVFSGLDHLEVFAEHRDYVSEVPERYKVLSAKNGVPYLLYHPEMEFYGAQFVPELSDRATQLALIRFLTGSGLTSN